MPRGSMAGRGDDQMSIQTDGIKFAGAALVTGGSKGIGEGCARALCGAGARVAIADVDAAAGPALAGGEALTRAGPGECRFLACDVRDAGQLKATIEAAAEKFGRLDCLVNNA